MTGQPYAQAQSALQSAHLSPDRVDAFDETIPAGVVISTDPGAGSELRRSQDVTVTVSKGPERYAVPQVVGASANEATARIRAEKLTVGDTKRAFSETVADGLVISVSPKEGASLKRGAKVNLVVSKGREPIEVTDFTGKPADDAVKDLTGKGLEVDATQQENDDTVPKGSVISQSPSSGTVFKGDKVTLVVSKGPELVKVPDVAGQAGGAGAQDPRGRRFPGQGRAFHGRHLRHRPQPEPRRRQRAAQEHHRHPRRRLSPVRPPCDPCRPAVWPPCS